MQAEKARERFVETAEPFNLESLISVLNGMMSVCVFVALCVCFSEK